VETQNNLKHVSYAGCVTVFKTRRSHAVRFSFIPVVMKSPGLKPIEVQNARSSSACVPYLATMRQERPPHRSLFERASAKGFIETMLDAA
jgi:hypothetical protein